MALAAPTQKRPCNRKSLKGQSKRVRDSLSVREAKFAHAYADPDSPTYENGAKSAVSSGYAPSYPPTKLTRRPRIAREIERIRAAAAAARARESAISVAWVRNEHQTMYYEARERKDWFEARAHLEALGKSAGAYRDGITIDIDVRRYDDSLAESARALGIALSLAGVSIECAPEPAAAKPEEVQRGAAIDWDALRVLRDDPAEASAGLDAPADAGRSAAADPDGCRASAGGASDLPGVLDDDRPASGGGEAGQSTMGEGAPGDDPED